MWTSGNCRLELFVWHTSHLMSLQIGRLYLISSIWLHRSFIKSSITNKMQILQKLQLMTAGCLFYHNNSKSGVGSEPSLPPSPQPRSPSSSYYSVLSLQCTWEACSRPRLLDRVVLGKNIWCAVKLSSSRYWPVALVTTGNHPMYHCLCMGPAHTSILAWCNKGQHLAEHPGYSYTLAIIQGNIGQIGFKPYLVQLFWQILDDFSTLITVASTQYIVSDDCVWAANQWSERWPHATWTLDTYNNSTRSHNYSRSQA